MVLAVPDVPGPARPPARRAPARCSNRTCRTPGSCSTVRPRCSTTTSRSGPRRPTTLRRLAASQRLSIGPWMILMDEFMVSGETIVRDLQMGIHRATEFGGPMEVGYLPDMFGHVAQMPQILRAGRARARGRVARRAVGGHPERVLVGGTRRLARARRVPLRLVLERARPARRREAAHRARARQYEVEIGDARIPGSGLLLMNGTDHQMPQPWLGRIVAEANAVQDDYRFVVTSLPEYLADQPIGGLAHLDRRAALRRAGQRAHGRGVEPRRRPPGVRRGRARDRAAGRAARARCCSRPTRTPAGCSTSPGACSCSTARTTRRARAAPTRSSTR